MMDYIKSAVAGTQKTYDAGLRSYMLKVYGYMGLALLISAIADLAAWNLPIMRSLLFTLGSAGEIVGTSGLGWLVMLAPVGIALYFFWGIGSMSLNTAKILFWTYAALTGISLSTLMMTFTCESVARAFFVCATLFGAMSLYGYTTNRDLSSFGSFLIMGLMGLILASILNFFFKSASMHFAISIIGVLIFTGLIAWDTQKLKAIYYSNGGGEAGQKMSLVGAFNLYLDFLNLFLYLLRFLGDRRN